MLSYVFSFGLFALPTIPLANDFRIVPMEQMQGTWEEKNRTALIAIAKRGDDCTRRRLIRHFVPGRLIDLMRMKASLPQNLKAELQVDPPNLIFPNIGSCSVQSLTRRGLEIERIAHQFNLRYDGWDMDYAPQ
ncbi:MAG: hypothetical protein ACRCWF_00100 [Beijerinckiaceae bacterium]